MPPARRPKRPPPVCQSSPQHLPRRQAAACRMACLRHRGEPLVPHLPPSGLGVDLHHAGVEGRRRRRVVRICRQRGLGGHCWWCACHAVPVHACALQRGSDSGSGSGGACVCAALPSATPASLAPSPARDAKKQATFGALQRMERRLAADCVDGCMRGLTSRVVASQLGDPGCRHALVRGGVHGGLGARRQHGGLLRSLLLDACGVVRTGRSWRPNKNRWRGMCRVRGRCHKGSERRSAAAAGSTRRVGSTAEPPGPQAGSAVARNINTPQLAGATTVAVLTLWYDLEQGAVGAVEDGAVRDAGDVLHSSGSRTARAQRAGCQLARAEAWDAGRQGVKARHGRGGRTAAWRPMAAYVLCSAGTGAGMRQGGLHTRTCTSTVCDSAPAGWLSR